MQITIIGAVNFDRIITPDGSEKSSLGGIFYNLLSVAPLLSSNSKIYPLIRVGKQHWSQVLLLLRKYPNVDLRGAKISPRGTNENLLIYLSGTERKEKLKLRTSPFTFEEVKPYLHTDLILLNFITGSEIQLSLLKKIRNNSDSIIYVDIHSKVLGMKEDGVRYPLGWPDWEEWLKHTDIVQMNIEECKLLLKERIESANDLQSAAKRIVEVGPTQVIITLGEDGAFVYWQNCEDQWKLIPASTHRVLDTTGCGDCFTAGYVWGLFKYRDPVKATCVANVVAGENCHTVGLIRELDANKIEKKTFRLYPDLFRR